MADENATQDVQTTIDIPDNTQLSDVAQEFLSQPQSKQDKILAPVGQDARKKAPKKEKEPVIEAADESPPEPTDEDPEDLADVVGGHSENTAKKSYKLKANGREYDVDSEDKLKDMAQRGLAAMQNWEKVKSEVEELKFKLRKQIDEYDQKEELVKRDPASFVKKFNEKAEDIMEQILLDRAKEFQAMEGMSPREKDLYLQNKQYQDKLKAQEAEQSERTKRAESDLVEHQKNQIAAVFSEALTKNKMPANSTTVRVMSSIYRAALQAGKELSVDQAAQMTRHHLEQISEHTSPKIDEMDAAEFVAKHPKLTEAIRKHLVAGVKGKPTEASDMPRTARAKDGKYVKSDVPDSGKDWDKYIEKLKKEGNALNVKSRW